MSAIYTDNGDIDIATIEAYNFSANTANSEVSLNDFEATAVNGEIDIFGDNSELINLEGKFPLIKTSSENGNIVVE